VFYIRRAQVCDMRAPSDRVVLEAVVGELRARAATLLPQEARTAHLGASTLHRRLTKQAHDLSVSAGLYLYHNYACVGSTAGRPGGGSEIGGSSLWRRVLECF
jgi:hypothetical protein